MISDKNYSFWLKCFYHVLEWKYEQMQLHLLGVEAVLKDKHVLPFLLFSISQRSRNDKSGIKNKLFFPQFCIYCSTRSQIELEILTVPSEPLDLVKLRIFTSHAFEKSQNEQTAPMVWVTRVRGGSEGLLPPGAFPEESPFPDLCCSPQVMECCSSCGVLILLPSCWQHKPLYLLRREIASCKGKEKINMVYALGQLCQCSVLCLNMISLWRSTAPGHTVCKLAAGFPFSSSIQNPLEVTAFWAFWAVMLFLQSFWLGSSWHCGTVMQKGCRTKGSLARVVQIGNDVLILASALLWGMLGLECELQAVLCKRFC